MQGGSGKFLALGDPALGQADGEHCSGAVRALERQAAAVAFEKAVAEATEYLLAQKDKVSAFTYDTQALIASGDIAAGHFFVGVNILVKERPDELGYVIPSEGATMYQENICVLESAPNQENAKKFLEFYLRPEIAALNVAQQMNGTPNLPARDLTPDYIKDDPNINLSAETMSRLQVFEDLGSALRVYDRAWNRVRTAQ